MSYQKRKINNDSIYLKHITHSVSKEYLLFSYTTEHLIICTMKGFHQRALTPDLTQDNLFSYANKHSIINCILCMCFQRIFVLVQVLVHTIVIRDHLMLCLSLFINEKITYTLCNLPQR